MIASGPLPLPIIETNFESGEAEIARLVDRHEARFGPLRRGRALDHGCGVGRLTLPLSDRFEEVVGSDVSPAMLDEAAANAAASGRDNARFAWLTID